jgi:glycosyltransferase involved in cell wall biosynthesis
MRIVLLTKKYPPQTCGVGDYAHGLAEALRAQGHEVVVLVASHAAPRPAGAREIVLERWSDVRAALRTIREERPDLVLLEYSGYSWGRYGVSLRMNWFALRLRLSGVRLAVAFHELSIRLRSFPRWALLSLAQKLHTALLALTASEVVTNTPSRIARLRRWMFWRRRAIHYRPNSSNIPVTPLDAAQRQALRAARGAGPQTVVAAVFGNFSTWKRYEDAVGAVARLLGAHDVRLWLLGDAEGADAAYLSRLRAQIAGGGMEKIVWWSGRLTPEEVSAHLQAADVFILPQADGDLTRSGAFMAAAAHGLPVIAVRNAENQAEFAHATNVWLVNRAGVKELSAALEQLAADAALRSRLGGALRMRYAERFSVERVTEMLALFREAPETGGREAAARAVKS